MKNLLLLAIALVLASCAAQPAAASDYVIRVSEPRPFLAQSQQAQASTSTLTPPPILTFAPGSSYSVSGLITPKGKTALDVATPIGKVALGKSKLWSLESDALAGIYLGGNANAGFGIEARYDSVIPVLGWSLYFAAGLGELIPIGAGNGPQVAGIFSFGVSIPVK